MGFQDPTQPWPPSNACMQIECHFLNKFLISISRRRRANPKNFNFWKTSTSVVLYCQKCEFDENVFRLSAKSIGQVRHLVRDWQLLFNILPWRHRTSWPRKPGTACGLEIDCSNNMKWRHLPRFGGGQRLPGDSNIERRYHSGGWHLDFIQFWELQRARTSDCKN